MDARVEPAHAGRDLRTGDAVFEKIGVLQARELDGDAILEMTHDPAGCPADGACRHVRWKRTARETARP